MKKEVKAAELKRYNANSRGTRTGDCVNRALSLALDIPYQEMRKILNERAKDHGGAWNVQTVYYPIMKEHGCSEWKRDGLGYKDGTGKVTYTTQLEDFVDNIADPSKTYLVITGKNGLVSDHIVCVRDGKVWDSWDSRDQIVFKYSEAPQNTKQVAAELQLGTLAREYAEPAIDAQIKKYINRKKWNCNYWEIYTTRAINFQIKVSCNLLFDSEDWIVKQRKYSFDVLYVIEPTMTEEDAIKFIEDITKVRVYDRMYAIGDQEKKLKEAEEIKKQAGEEGLGREGMYLDKREQRFFNSLPGWVKPLVTSLWIQNPGQYSDSYFLSIKPLPNDPNKADRKRIRFEWYDSASVKDMLSRYKKNFEIPYDDYSPYEEY